MIAMLYNLKCRPFQALDQMTYIFLMLGGVSHNVARTADEVVNACVRDAQMRLIYRNRLNVIIYKNLEKLDPEKLEEPGVEGNFTGTAIIIKKYIFPYFNCFLLLYFLFLYFLVLKCL